MSPQETTKVGMRPTLMIGLGGTGQKVLVQLKGRFLRNYNGEVPDDIRFLCFDTDQTAEKAQIDDRVVTLTPDTELVNVGGIEPQSILYNLERYPAVATWITEDKEKIPARAINMGAQQVRPLGRLSLFWRVEILYNKITEAVRSLTRLDTTQGQRGINVFIVSSVCGGTGSGAILDVAYLTRYAIEKSGMSSSFCYINGVLALPDVFVNVEKVGIYSNAYACLREIDYFMACGEWHVDYGNTRVGVVDFRGRTPFNICYLINSINEHGKGLNGLEEIGPMIADALYLQIGSQVGRANDSVFDNVDALSDMVENPETGRKEPNGYSSFGTASLVFPANKIIQICAHRLGAQLLEKYVLKKEQDPARVDAKVKEFLQENMLEIEPLMQQVARDAKGNVLRIVVDPRVLDKYKENELMQVARQYLMKIENTVDNDFAQALDLNRRTIIENLAKKLEERVNALIDDDNYGLYFALAFLQKLDQALVAARTEMDKNREVLDQRKERQKQIEGQMQQAFAASFRTSIIGRGGRIRDARDRWLSSYQEYLTARFESRKREVGIAVLASMNSAIQSRRTAIQNTVDRLQFIQNQYAVYGEGSGKRSRVDYVLAQEITTPEDIDMFYADHWDRLGASPASMLIQNYGPVHDWLGMDQNAISDRILEYTRSVFADLRNISVEQEILRKREEVEPKKRLMDLIIRSVPFWNYKEAVMGQNWRYKKILVEGVYDREKSIYTGFSSGEPGTEEQTTSTLDSFTVTVLQTKHGLPLFGLTHFRDYASMHDQIMRAGQKPLYVFPEVRPGGETAKLFFALGLAYGFIFKSGVYYNVVPMTSGDAIIRLESGLEGSLRAFRANEDLVTYIKRMVEDQISKEGSQAAAVVISEWIKEPYVFELRGGTAKLTGNAIDRTGLPKDTSIGRPNSVNYDLVKGLRGSVNNYLNKVILG